MCVCVSLHTLIRTQQPVPDRYPDHRQDASVCTEQVWKRRRQRRDRHVPVSRRQRQLFFQALRNRRWRRKKGNNRPNETPLNGPMWVGLRSRRVSLKCFWFFWGWGGGELILARENGLAPAPEIGRATPRFRGAGAGVTSILGEFTSSLAPAPALEFFQTCSEQGVRHAARFGSCACVSVSCFKGSRA